MVTLGGNFTCATAVDAATAVPVSAMAASIIFGLIIPFLPLRLSLQP